MSDRYGLLIAIPYWAGDAHRVTTLAKLLAGLQDSHAGRTACIAPARRFDCPENTDAVAILRKKFDVFPHTGVPSQVGYPMGPNGLFISFFTMARYFFRDRVKAVLWLEPDAFPCRKDWISRLLAAWDARQAHVHAMGHIFSIDGLAASLHLNGGALYDPAFLDACPSVLNCSKQAWDWEQRHAIARVSVDTPEIRYMHLARGLEEIPDPTPSVIHGVKDDSLASLVVDRYKIELHTMA